MKWLVNAVSKPLLIIILLLLINYSLNHAFAATIDLNGSRVNKMIGLNLTNSVQIKDNSQPKGFLWYNENQVEENKEIEYDDSIILKQKFYQEPYEQRIEALKREFSKAKRKALDNPTLENVITAQRLHKQILEKSHKFATIWQLATLFDYSLTNNNIPANSLHKKLYEIRQDKDSSQKLRLLAKDWGLILQVNQGCEYCHAFTPIVLEFANKYKFQLLFVSNDGGNFTHIRTTKDTGLLRRLNPENLAPILYLVDGGGIQIYPVARGIISEDKIAENILLVVQHHNELKVSDYGQ